MSLTPANNSWLQNLGNGEAFSAENFLTPGAGLSAHIQLFNPMASGVRVRLRSVHAINVAAVTANVRRFDTALTTLGLPAGFIVENLLGGQPVSVAEMRSQASGPLLGTQFWALNSAASTPAIYPPEGREWGHDLLEGQGVLLQAGVAVTLIVNWQWVEIPL